MALFNTNVPVLAAKFVPVPERIPDSVNVPLVATRKLLFTSKLPIEPLPMTVPALVNISPTIEPPRLVIAPVLIHAFTTFNVPPLAIWTKPPLVTVVPVKPSVPLVTTTVPPAAFTNAALFVPNPISNPWFVNVPPAR